MDMDEVSDVSSVLSRPIKVPSGHASVAGGSEYDEELDLPQEDDCSVISASKNRQTPRSAKRSTPRTLPKYNSPAELLKVLKRQIKEDIERQQFDDVIANRVRVIALCRILFGPADRQLAEAYSQLSTSYLEYKRYGPQGKEHAEAARDIMLDVVPRCESDKEKVQNYATLTQTYYCLGHAFFLMKKYAEAEKSLSKVERILGEREKMSSVDTDQCDVVRIKLAKLQGKLAANQGKHAAAVTYIETSIDVIERLRGTDDLELIEVYHMLGKVEQGHGAFEKAVEANLQAHSIAAANFSDDSVEFIEATHTLAASYAMCGTPETDTTSETFYNSCIAGYQAVHGPDHVKPIQSQDELARLMIKTDRFDEAVKLLKSTIPARVSVYGDLSENVASTYKLIGSVYLSEGQNVKSLANLKKSESLFSLSFGKKHKKTKDVQKAIDVLLASDRSLSAPHGKSESMDARPRWG